MRRGRARRRNHDQHTAVGDARPGRRTHRRTSSAVRWLRFACWLYLFCVLAVWVLLHYFADRWWVATVLLFGPRWFAALPLICFVPLALVLDRKAMVPLSLAGLLVFWPIMGFNLSLRRSSAVAVPDLRLLTYNIGTDSGAPSPPLEDLWRLVRIAKPDVVTLQECNFSQDELVPMFPGYNTDAHAGTCFLSRFPIVATVKRDRADVIAVKGSGAIDRFEVATPRGVVSIANLHLATVRNGLQSVIDGSASAATQMHYSVAERRAESRVAREWVDRARVPQLIAGDFNISSDSQIFRRYWGDFGDAFAACGTGYGYTKFTKWFGIRIDHILFDSSWECLRVSVDTSMTQGDHRPVIAEFRLR